MRKIFLIILTVFLWLFGYAQFPINQNLGAPSTLVLNRGGFKSDSALIIPTYSDTVRANQSLGRTYPGNIIRVGNLVYMRNSTATGWVAVGSGGGGGGGSFDTVYAKYPIRVDTTGVKDTLYLAQPFLDSVYNNSPGFLDGLISVDGVDLIDTSAIIIAPIIWKRNGVVTTQNTNALFPIPRADTLNYRTDIIYISSGNVISYGLGIPDTINALAPAIPLGGILITYVNVYGSSRIVNPQASVYQRTAVVFIDPNTGQLTTDSTRFAWNSTNGSLIIGDQAANANPSAILQLTSNNRGFLMPTMSAALRNGITSPANGLMVYDTDSSALFYFNGNNWISLNRKPNLQQVTDIGDSTTNSISSYGTPCVSGIWETENLSVSNYANGDPIPEVTNGAAWASLTTGAWCWYNNDSATYWRRGKLYNFYAVNDPRGLAPSGYYIPSGNDFDDLAFCLGGITIAGGKMKSTNTWSAPNTGATNESGFNALPSGLRTATTGSFASINTDAYYWSSDISGSRVKNLTNTSATIFSTSGNDKAGYSVRLKRINGFNPFVQITSKTKIDPVGITFSKSDGTNSGSIILNNNNLTAKTSELKLPDSSGTLALSVNGNFANSKGNITIPSGSGTVTSVATGYGLSGGPITTTGTLIADTTVSGLSGKYLRIVDTANIAFRPSAGANIELSGTYPSITITGTGGSGGGSSINYYLNGSVNQGTFGGDTYYELSQTPILGAGTNFTRLNSAGNGYIASFITDVGEPNIINIPGGNWNLEFYFNASSGGGSPQFYGEVYKYDGSTFTLIASGSTNPETITNGTTVDQYFTSIPVPQTTLLSSDRLAVRVYVITGGRNITLHTEDNNLSEVLTSINIPAWKTSGNADVNAGQFIGSTNNATVRFRTNNVERMSIDSVGTVLVSSDETRATNNALYKFGGVNTLKPTVNSLSDYRVMYFSNEVNAPAINFTNVMQAGYFENRMFNAGTINYAVGLQSIGTRIGSVGATLTGVTNSDGVYASPVSDISSSTSATISTARGVRVANSQKNPSLTITNQVGLQVDANFNSGTNNTYILLGTNTAPTGNYSIYSANTTPSYFAGNIGIGVTTPAASSLVDMTSISKGLLIPRMSTSERNSISAPASQLLVANTTTNTIDMYSNSNWAKIAGDYGDDVAAYRELGSTIQAAPVPGLGTISAAVTMFTGRGYWSAVYVKRPITITGAAWFQTIAGSYTATNYNGVALYSYASGTLTLVDSSTRDNNIWTTTTGTWGSKAFAGGSRTLAPGIYYVAAIFNNSAVPTPPQIGAIYTGTSTVGYTAPLTTNSARISGWETSITTPPTTKLMSSFSGQGIYLGLCLY